MYLILQNVVNAPNLTQQPCIAWNEVRIFKQILPHIDFRFFVLDGGTVSTWVIITAAVTAITVIIVVLILFVMIMTG